MNNLTWGKFKKLVEMQGIKDRHKISRIEMSGERNPEVTKYDESFFSIFHGESRDPERREKEKS